MISYIVIWFSTIFFAGIDYRTIFTTIDNLKIRTQIWYVNLHTMCLAGFLVIVLHFFDECRNLSERSLVIARYLVILILFAKLFLQVQFILFVCTIIVSRTVEMQHCDHKWRCLRYLTPFYSPSGFKNIVGTFSFSLQNVLVNEMEEVYFLLNLILQGYSWTGKI